MRRTLCIVFGQTNNLSGIEKRIYGSLLPTGIVNLSKATVSPILHVTLLLLILFLLFFSSTEVPGERGSL